MAFDPSIISAIPDYAPHPIEARARAVTLKDAMDREQLNSLHLGQEQQEAAEGTQVNEILKGSDYSTPKGLAETAAKVNKVSPKAGMELLRTGQQYQSGKIQNQIDQLTLADARQGLIVSAIDPIVAQARAMKNSGASELAVKAYITQQMPTALQGLRDMKLEDGAPALPDDQLKMATSVPYTLETLEGWENKSKAGQQAIRGRLEQFKADTQAQRENNDERRLDETTRHNQATEDAADKKAATGGKAPSGFEWDPDKPGELRPIKGGPKDPDSKPWSGREKIFSQRILTSANEAVKAIKNITELPIGASSGVFGVGEGPGHGLFSSAKSALQNKLSTQDTQDYNTMLAGVKRNLATIESVGLAPSGALTEGFASLELREGDSNITKLRKLAEMRQIVDAGLEVQIADPAIPQVLKDVMHKVLNEVQTAVPYTQSDVTTLQRAQRTNPDFTLQDLIGQQNLRKGGNEESPGAAPPQGAAPSAPGGGAAPGGPLKPGSSYKHASGATVEILD